MSLYAALGNVKNQASSSSSNKGPRYGATIVDAEIQFSSSGGVDKIFNPPVVQPGPPTRQKWAMHMTLKLRSNDLRQLDYIPFEEMREGASCANVKLVYIRARWLRTGESRSNAFHGAKNVGIDSPDVRRRTGSN